MKRKVIGGLIAGFIVLLVLSIVSFFVDFGVFSYIIYGLLGINFLLLVMTLIKKNVKRERKQELSENGFKKIGKGIAYFILALIIGYILLLSLLL